MGGSEEEADEIEREGKRSLMRLEYSPAGDASKHLRFDPKIHSNGRFLTRVRDAARVLSGPSEFFTRSSDLLADFWWEDSSGISENSQTRTG